MNHINICPSCTHNKNCVLTVQKDKVWSCSEFDEEVPVSSNSEKLTETVEQQKQTLELV